MAFAIPSKNRVRDRERARDRDRGRKKSAEKSGERWRERHGRWRLEQDDRDIALCFLSGQMIYRVSPCISPRANSHAKTRKGLQESPKATTTTTTEGGGGEREDLTWGGGGEKMG
jgi:hypothetical protein